MSAAVPHRTPPPGSAPQLPSAAGWFAASRRKLAKSLQSAAPCPKPTFGFPGRWTRKEKSERAPEPLLGRLGSPTRPPTHAHAPGTPALEAPGCPARCASRLAPRGRLAEIWLRPRGGGWKVGGRCAARTGPVPKGRLQPAGHWGMGRPGVCPPKLLQKL